jgi:hypothetical protein
MFELDKTISGVYDFLFLQKDELLIVGKDNKYHFEVQGQLVEDFFISNPNLLFILYNDHVYYSEGLGMFYSFDLKSKTRDLVTEKKMSPVNSDENDFLCTTNNNGIYSEIIDIETGKILLTLPFRAVNTLFTSYFYCTSSRAFDKLYCYSREPYQSLWELDVSKLGVSITGDNLNFKGEVVTTIGEWNGFLLLHISHCKIIAVNKEGEIAWEIENFLTPEENAFFKWNTVVSIKSSIQWLLNAENGKLYLFGKRYIMEFDLLTREKTILHDCSQVPSEQDWSFFTGKLVDKYILFKAYTKSLGPNLIGLFDLTSNSMSWHFKLEDPDDSFLKDPDMHNNKIYALSDKKDLRVFKQV